MKIEKQRLFFALWPEPALRRALQRVQAQFSGGRRTHVDDLHVTLVFLGDVTMEAYPCVTRAADEVSAVAFDLELDRIGYWRRPRILWCGASSVPPALGKLVTDLQEGLTRCGFEPEHRAYAPHVTLARKARPMDERPVPEPLLWRPAEFVLVSSSGGAPPLYRVVKKWRFER